MPLYKLKRNSTSARDQLQKGTKNKSFTVDFKVTLRKCCRKQARPNHNHLAAACFSSRLKKVKRRRFFFFTCAPLKAASADWVGARGPAAPCGPQTGLKQWRQRGCCLIGCLQTLTWCPPAAPQTARR